MQNSILVCLIPVSIYTSKNLMLSEQKSAQKVVFNKLSSDICVYCCCNYFVNINYYFQMKSKKDQRKSGRKDIYQDVPAAPKAKKGSVKKKKKNLRQELYEELDEFENLSYSGNLKFLDEEES